MKVIPTLAPLTASDGRHVTTFPDETSIQFFVALFISIVSDPIYDSQFQQPRIEQRHQRKLETNEYHPPIDVTYFVEDKASDPIHRHHEQRQRQQDNNDANNACHYPIRFKLSFAVGAFSKPPHIQPQYPACAIWASNIQHRLKTSRPQRCFHVALPSAQALTPFRILANPFTCKAGKKWGQTPFNHFCYARLLPVVSLDRLLQEPR
jgi:hypothetical protein